MWHHYSQGDRFFKIIFYWLCYYRCPNFSPVAPLHPVSHFPPAISTPLSSCPWVVHISSLASLFPILFLTSSCLFCTYQLCFLIPEPFPLLSLSSLPVDNPPNVLHICDYVPVLVVCLVCFCFLIQLLIVVSLLLF